MSPMITERNHLLVFTPGLPSEKQTLELLWSSQMKSECVFKFSENHCNMLFNFFSNSVAAWRLWGLILKVLPGSRPHLLRADSNIRRRIFSFMQTKQELQVCLGLSASDPTLSLTIFIFISQAAMWQWAECLLSCWRGLCGIFSCKQPDSPDTR